MSSVLPRKEEDLFDDVRRGFSFPPPRLIRRDHLGGRERLEIGRPVTSSSPSLFFFLPTVHQKERERVV